MNLVGDPVAINQMATGLERNAAQIRSVGQRLQRRTDDSRSGWQCKKADGFRRTMATRRARLEQIADDFNGLAHELRIVATQLQTQIDFLHSLERRARDAIAAAGHDVAWARQHGIDLTRLPAPLDPAWETIVKNLKA